MNDLLKEIISKLHPSKEIIPFYEKSIQILGIDRVRGFLKDIELDSKHGHVANKAKLFTYWLKEALPKTELRKGNVSKKYNNIQQLIDELSLKTNKEQDIIIELPSRKNGIEKPILTSIYPFFTLSTNKNKSDEIAIKIKTYEGDTEGILIRGRLFKNSEERGILNVSDSRVFDCILDIWKAQDCRVSLVKSDKSEQSFMTGVVKFSLQALAEKYGIQRSGASDKWILKSLERLKATPYCLLIGDGNHDKWYGFYLISGLTITGRNKKEKSDKIEIFISLSPEITRQYYNRHYLPYSKGSIKLRNELAYLMWQYLERIIEARNGIPDTVTTLKLIEKLHLPPASWHLYKSTRWREFNKAIVALKDMKTAKSNATSIEWVHTIDEKEDNLIRFGYKEYYKELTQVSTKNDNVSNVPIIIATPKTNLNTDYYSSLSTEGKSFVDNRINTDLKNNNIFKSYKEERRNSTLKAFRQQYALEYINDNK